VINLLHSFTKKTLTITLAIVIGAGYWIYQGYIHADTGPNHQLPYDSVDGGEVRYNMDSKYSTAWTHAINQWNSLDEIYIAPDSGFVIADVRMYDSYTTEGICGRYTHYSGSIDSIMMNTRFLDTRGDSYDKWCTTHELGHALGIEDHDSSTYDDIIMYYMNNQETNLQFHDKHDYFDRW
jgi:hypothetical protein